MTDDEKPSKKSESNDGWVTLGSFWSSRRVPGIEETTEPTYVAPKENIPRRTLIIGIAILLASIAIGTGLVFAAGSDGDSKASESELGAPATLTSSTTVVSTTTTTAPPTTSTSSTVGLTPPTTRAATPTTRAGATPVAAAAVPRATADPALPPFQGVPLPAGVTATLTAGSCRWVGGTLQSSGTITSTSAAGHRWNMTMHWLQGGRELAKVSGLMDLQPHESKPWSLTLSQANPPADLACSLEVSVP